MSESIFTQVKQAVRISDYVRSLPQTSGLHSVGGSRWRCNNVIAGGTNPNAMMLDDDEGFFKCFSHDQQGGDVITLHSLVSGTESLADAARDLARQMGVPITDDGPSKPSLRPMMDAIATAAHERLMADADADAGAVLDYLDERGMEEELIRQWRLGVLPSNRSDSLGFLAEHGDMADLHRAGMVSGDRDFVSMAGRLLFPILSTSGSCLSFSSRVVPGVETPLPDSKYINTKSTPIYDKSAVLYGQHLLAGRKDVKVIICEGNFDVIALNASTDSDTVALATCGTALTEGHVKLISKRAQEVSILFDSDEAGQKAAASALWTVNHLDNLYLATIDGEDPWDCYVAGNLAEINKDPFIEGVVKSRHRVMSRQELMEWSRRAVETLNFTDDRKTLLDVSETLLGAQRGTVAPSDTKPAKLRPNQRPTEGYTPSPETARVVAALLLIESGSRSDVAYPLVVPTYQDHTLDFLGIYEPPDIDLVTTVASGHTHPDMYSLVTDPDSSPAISDLCRHLAMLIMRRWTSSRPDEAVDYIGTLAHISATGGDVEHLSMLMDLIAASR